MTDETQEQQITAVGNEMSASFLAAKKRSNATLAKLEEHPEKFTMLTGDRPTGRLHLGHYFGSIRERVAMQNRGVNSNIIIADYQVITDRDTTEHIEDNVLNLVLDYMAAGIDPNKTMIFTHSAVPAENQLMLPFLSLVTEAELHRNPTVKSEMEASGHALTGLLLTYPVHQACDILFCKANVVPIGKDNLPHVEITRTIALRINERYAKKNPDITEPSAIMPNSSLMPNMATMFRATLVASWMSWAAPLVMVPRTTSSAARPPMETTILASSSSRVRSSVLSSSGISRV